MHLTPRPFGEVLGQAMSGLAQVWRPLLPTALMVFLPIGAVTLLVFNVTGAIDFLDAVLNDPGYLEALDRGEFFDLAGPFLWAVGIAVALQGIGSVFVYVASHLAMAGHLAGRPLGGALSRRTALRRFPTALAAVLIVAIAITAIFAVGAGIWLIPFVMVGTPNAASALVALVLLVVFVGPSIWLFVSFSMVTSVVALEGSGAISSLRRSFALVRARWWQTFGYILLVGLVGSFAVQLIQIVAVPLAVVGDATSGLTLASVFGVAVQGLFIAAIGAMYTNWYVDLRARAEPLATDDLMPG